MTIVTISPVKDASGADVVAYATVILVDETGAHRIGWQVSTGGPISEYRNVRFCASELALSLVPQDDIAIDANGTSTWYKITLSTGNRDEPYLIQVPDLTEGEGEEEEEAEVSLVELIGADAVDPATFMANRLLPLGGTNGQFIVADVSGSPQWATKFTGFSSIAAVDTLPVPEVTGVLYLVKT